MLRLQDQNQTVQERLELLTFLDDVDDNNGGRKMTQFENVNISKDVWQKWATHGSRQNDAVRNCEFPGGHSNILKSLDRKC